MVTKFTLTVIGATEAFTIVSENHNMEFHNAQHGVGVGFVSN